MAHIYMQIGKICAINCSYSIKANFERGRMLIEEPWQFHASPEAYSKIAAEKTP